MQVNKKTRDEIGSLCRQIEELANILEELRDEQQDKFDNHAEAWQDSDAGTECQSNIDELDQLATELQDLAERIDTTFDEND
jgi:DNA repair exonuclease SbcCD ATPase subunit